MRGYRRLFSGAPLPLLLAALVVVAIPGLAVAAWDGVQDIGLGDKVQAVFASGGTAHHEFDFYAPKGTVLDVKAKVAKGSNLVLGFDLYSTTQQVDLGATDGPLGVAKFVIPADGEYSLHVRAVSGFGAYALATKGKFPKKIAATVPLTANPGTGEITFGAHGGTILGAKVKVAKGSTAVPTFDTLTCPGDEVPIVAGPALAKVALPHDHEYTLNLKNTGPAGNALVAVALKYPKFKSLWSFGPVADPVGSNPEIRADWLGSGHADASSEAFRHWDEDGSVSASCAKCHSSIGYRDYIGADGSAPGAINFTVPLGTTVDCEACHNPEAAALESVTFPSGLSVSGLDASARCMQCHQGRESSVSMDTMITGSNLAVDGVATGTVPRGSASADGKLSFKNVHYLAAGATLYGNKAKGGYQYAGKVYPDRFVHVESYDSCVECHDQHTLEVRTSDCTACHTGTDPEQYRLTRSNYDYDGDGNTTEGIKGEIDGLAAVLYDAIQQYAPAVTTHAILYDASDSPYWFQDTNANDVHDTGDEDFTTFTPRLVRACYNYQYLLKDPGAYAHNSRYVIALLYDSIADLDSHADVTVTGMADLVRNDQNHFDYTAQAWNYSYFYPTVRAGCGRCHSPDGFKFYAEYVSKSGQIDNPNVISKTYNGMNCESCHATGADFGDSPALRPVAAVWFPGGKMIENTTSDSSFTCLTCHQGRESKVTVDEMITLSGLADDAAATGTVASGKKGEPDKLSFKNLHYLPAGAMLFGADAQVGYQYSGKTYEGKFTHSDGTLTATDGFQCAYCHLSDHTFRPKLLTLADDATRPCQTCHTEAAGNLDAVRKNRPDYDANAATTTLESEIEVFEERLEEAIEGYAETHGGGIVYDPLSHPYFFRDFNLDGVPDVDAASKKIGYDAFTPRLVRATFNFQFAHKEPGAWAHNTKYVLQLLYDSIQDLGGDLTGLTRPVTL